MGGAVLERPGLQRWGLPQEAGGRGGRRGPQQWGWLGQGRRGLGGAGAHAGGGGGGARLRQRGGGVHLHLGGEGQRCINGQEGRT